MLAQLTSSSSPGKQIAVVKKDDRQRSPQRRSACTDESGQALIEVALSAPILLMMVFGILQFGVIMQRYVSLNDAIRSGARALAMTRGTADPCSTAATKTRNGAIGLDLSGLNLTFRVNGSTYGPGLTPSCSGQGVNMTAGADVVASGTYPCSAVIYGINYIPGCTLSAQSTVRVE